MNKEEILEKSRSENKDQDLYEKEVMKDASQAGVLTAGVLATIFFIIQIFAGGGMNYGLYSIVFAINSATFIYKAIKLKRKHEIFVAIAYTLLTLVFASAHIYNLVTGEFL